MDVSNENRGGYCPWFVLYAEEKTNVLTNESYFLFIISIKHKLCISFANTIPTWDDRFVYVTEKKVNWSISIKICSSQLRLCHNMLQIFILGHSFLGHSDTPFDFFKNILEVMKTQLWYKKS